MDNHSPALFLGDALALDFLNSVATPVDEPVDWIEDGEGLLRWLKQTGLVSPEALEAMRAQALPGELDKVADQARNLREWFRTFVRGHKGKPLTPDALTELEPLNRLLERDEGYSRVVARQTDEGQSLELQPMRKWRSPEALLLPVGEALGRFVCTEDFSNVKACEGPSCTLLFADHTRGHRRRWCSMALCGNRAKQAAHRHRHRLT
ncbi:CGNR zinc finger domain-containing protein [Rhizobium mayense]|uniref:CGNR zinc finger domain-containing protein n=1 Tax=Rhizobium mayense TaxID=1312184 RepID=A0ABT7JP80_9HYPH|nr:ABATE domain-containing protein [Rhizobium mayense]MDL2398151.1 CGNR zinc finger domain-containing protein [Rhizobium mayense]